ncbi:MULTISPECIES: uroporphyrinogen-III synthase [Mammaliicoccus]|uniref:Uroporphyrinogen-III synthase n=1 Tax=Mammaliicoccus fleurettii TaxID=150056 RepID=A0ABS5MPA1_9STAP|nr:MULTISPECIES: uroporphyrinogen-III synthase [Mammaliicoccus]HCN61482.1 uroporphyrinogen-III synthase [Staphylococcus sp.]MBL0847673.1 uroporphyrinogen-III synthase [Mammaliicoccus fleurettii]MBS3672422.1 uroporphyrinogen-III synthase [Mammaliicoccus fleurettii]MBS3697457.1 uroporphyrinogen-III synthase [Mammaliicoccus fleurettii]MBW0764237.1 uroporphyrinogen-III synthase [Mammaliicoccus fleurettii]
MKPIIVVTSTRTVQREDVEIRHYPFIDIVPIQFEQSCLKPHYDWLIFTSVNAIKIFEPYLPKIQVNHIAVIGSKTKKIAEKLNIPVDTMPETFTQEGMLNDFKDKLYNQSVLIPCSKQARDKLTTQLSEWSNQVQRLNIYEPVTNTDNVHKVHELITNNKVTHITFSSSSAVSSYFETYKEIGHGVEVYAIGEITQQKLNTYHQTSKIALESTLEDMINTILKEVKL